MPGITGPPAGSAPAALCRPRAAATLPSSSISMTTSLVQPFGSIASGAKILFIGAGLSYGYDSEAARTLSGEGFSCTILHPIPLVLDGQVWVRVGRCGFLFGEGDSRRLSRPDPRIARHQSPPPHPTPPHQRPSRSHAPFP